MRLAVIMLIACGAAPAPQPAKILPPNTEQVCARAEECSVFLPEQRNSCVACLEHIDPVELEKIRAEYGELPPLESVDCESLRLVVVLYTNLAKCVSARWYGP